MEEVFSLKGDGHARHRDIIIVTRAVVDICTDSKCNWFGLPEQNDKKYEKRLMNEKNKTQICHSQTKHKGLIRPP